MIKANTNTQQDTTIIPFTEEKGDIEHAIRCTRQALNRAQSPWLKEACAYRLKMLSEQLTRQRTI
ncbi:MAG: hypothetical protein IKS41_07365 [Alphaproteobacteria bacterium]|nr:hypothetical protein [Alphaproteobacteria bacterium]